MIESHDRKLPEDSTLSSNGQMGEENKQFLSLLPLKNVVILPKSIIPIIVGRKTSLEAVEHALKHDKTIFITSQKDPSIEEPQESDLYAVGTRSTILQVMRMPNGALKILAEGISRAKIIYTTDEKGFMGVIYENLPMKGLEDEVGLEATWRHLKGLYSSYSQLQEKAPADLAQVTINSPQDFSFVADTMAVHVGLSSEERQIILETLNLQQRMVKICAFLKREIEIMQAEQRVRGNIQNQVEKGQREYYLNEQMKAIQKELGRGDQNSELDKIRKKIKKIGLPQEAKEKVEKELNRLEQMPPLSSEAVVSRNYVDWISSLPWVKASRDSVSLTQAERLLNKKHAGLVKAKERILEFLAAKKYNQKSTRSPIICLAGPPGVGKTSLAKSIAESLGRKFIRISLGGVRDEAEIRGHRRTYIGALPGKIIQAMKRAQTVNPVILLDEIDKMNCDMQGDPSSALLEVLDPEQNQTFMDHFLDVDYDLSKVMFITTANVLDDIPYPLYDRMEIISLSGYTEEEKLEIARKFLIPKNFTEHALTATQFKIDPTVLRTIVSKYTKEAGVRQLERIIAKLMRKSIQVFLKNKEVKSVTITPSRVIEWLGHPKVHKTSLNNATKRIGLATGLAWTELGGDVLEIETSTVSGKGGLTLTGQLGEVMQESAQAALSYIRSRATKIGLKASFYTTKDIHIHMPEGATPKDGPSAGISICSSLISALTQKETPKDLAMTGEITLQGRVLSVGGLKEKLLAAKQHNMKTVLVPRENENDIKEVLKEADLGDLTIHFVSSMDEVLTFVFPSGLTPKKTVNKPAPKRKTAKK